MKWLKNRDITRAGYTKKGTGEQVVHRRELETVMKIGIRRARQLMHAFKRRHKKSWPLNFTGIVITAIVDSYIDLICQGN